MPQARRHGIEVVPFFNLTAPRHDMHYGKFCSYNGQKKLGSCCDCTHFCYTPVFWDTVFDGLYRAILRRAGRYAVLPAAYRQKLRGPGLADATGSVVRARAQRVGVAARAGQRVGWAQHAEESGKRIQARG